jgi:hypothetical protein
MTKKERAQVVELLRCAADHVLRGDRPETALTTTTGSLFTSTLFGAGGVANKYACRAEQVVCAEFVYGTFGDWITFGPARFERLLRGRRPRRGRQLPMTRRAVSRACGHRLQFFTGAIVYAPHESSLLGGTFGPGWATVVGQSKCAGCGETMPLGPSNDAPDEVQVEIAAAAKVTGPGWMVDPHAESLAFAHGWNGHISSYAGEDALWMTDDYAVGYLAHAIADHDHDRITEHGND